MKKTTIVIIFCLISLISLQAENLKELKMTGYSAIYDDLNKKQLNTKLKHQRLNLSSADLFDPEGFISTTGLSGTIDIPSAYILKTGELACGYTYIYKDGLLNYQGTLKDVNQNEKIFHLNYGLTQNSEIGFNFLDSNSDITGMANQNLTLTTLNYKFAFDYLNTLIALGGHYTDITPKDQLMLSYSQLEKANSFFVSVSDRLTPYLDASICIKSSFIRSVINIPAFQLDSTSFLTTGLSFDYSRIQGIHFVAELKKMNGDYILGDNDFTVNLGFKVKNNKLHSSIFMENINNSSDKIYGYTANYNF